MTFYGVRYIYISCGFVFSMWPHEIWFYGRSNTQLSKYSNHTCSTWSCRIFIDLKKRSTIFFFIQDDLRIENRKKNLIILVLQWLAEEGYKHIFRSNHSISFYIYFSYIESARQLEHETNLDVSKYDVCDNIDLDTILQEYEFVFFTRKWKIYVFCCLIRSYFYIKFNRYPKLTKKNGLAGKLILFVFFTKNKTKQLRSWIPPLQWH